MGERRGQNPPPIGGGLIEAFCAQRWWSLSPRIRRQSAAASLKRPDQALIGDADGGNPPPIGGGLIEARALPGTPFEPVSRIRRQSAAASLKQRHHCAEHDSGWRIRRQSAAASLKLASDLPNGADQGGIRRQSAAASLKQPPCLQPALHLPESAANRRRPH